MINWQLHAYDGDERRWLGYIDGEEEYCVHRGTFSSMSDDDFADSYEDEMHAINCCEAHHKYGQNWVKKMRTDPLLSQ
jgi:hypothetical protein